MADARERLKERVYNNALNYVDAVQKSVTDAFIDDLLDNCRGDLAEAAGLPRLDSVDVVTPTLGLLLRVQDALGVLREAGWTVSVHRDLRGNERELVARYLLRESRDGN